MTNQGSPGRTHAEGSLLSVRDATKEFPGVLALDHVSLDLNKGEVLALVGENGAGKSTLMKLLSGIYKPDEGEFWLEGERFVPENPKHAQELGISIIHQELNLVPDLTVAENIFMGRESLRGPVLAKFQQVRKAAELLDRLGLHLDPNTVVGSLSVAHQQMVEIAKALSRPVKVLIMDEPTASLNDNEVEALFGIIRRFLTDETAVIYISHRLKEIPVVADRIEVLRDGANAGMLNAKTCTEREIISKMVGREITSNTVPKVPLNTPMTLEVDRLSTTGMLSDVSFIAHEGEILGLAGLMGSGRTELARAIIGADPVKSGEIRKQGRVIHPDTPSKAAALGIGYLSEDRKGLGVLLDQTVQDNVVLSSLPRFTKGVWIDEKGIRTSATEYVELLNIRTPSTAQKVANLSGGNQQKVVIAKWLLKDCDVLIFDEPTRGIDVGAKEEIYGLLERLAGEGKTVIVISSELPEVMRLSNRIAVMCEGRLTGVLPGNEATQESIMRLATTKEEKVYAQ